MSDIGIIVFGFNFSFVNVLGYICRFDFGLVIGIMVILVVFILSLFIW